MSRNVITVSAIGISLILIFASGPFFQKLKFDIFPSTKDSDGIAISISFDNPLPINQAESIVDDINRGVTSSLGEEWVSVAYSNSGSSRGALGQVQLTSFKDRDVTSPQLIERLSKDIESPEGTRLRFSQIDAGPPREEFPFKLQIYGDQSNARNLATQISSELLGAQVKRANGTKAEISKTAVTPESIVTRSDNKLFTEVSAGFEDTDTSALVIATEQLVREKFPTDRIQEFGLIESDLVYDFGSESDNQESFIGAIPL